MKFTHDEIADAQRTVYAAMPPTPQYAWPLLAQRLGATVWAKHENHTPAGAFKIRGGLTIVVPHGNSVEKNAAMRALGVTLVEHGDEFQTASEHAALLAERDGLHRVPSFHRDLVRGVATAYVEFFEALKHNPPDVLFVPIGLGSGFAGAAAARAHVGVPTKLIGVVSTHATAYRDSFIAGRALESPVSTVLADGMACRTPVPEALEVIRQEADDVVTVSDDEVAEAMRALFTDTHNVAEGAGAAALAAAMQQRERWRGQTVGISVTGGNVDAAMFGDVLQRH
ncbi:MAG: threonine dehydratase [Variovorax sp.]|nr:MAG: threonine dehydratase [Variovorax sp.]